MTTNGAWVDGVFYDGIALTAADLNANNQWILAQADSTVLLNTANDWLALQSYPGTLITTPSTFVDLPASPVDGQRAFITNAAALTFGSAVAGGGSLHGPVYYDGSSSSWKAG
jgi:hypothetical protein